MIVGVRSLGRVLYADGYLPPSIPRLIDITRARPRTRINFARVLFRYSAARGARRAAHTRLCSAWMDGIHIKLYGLAFRHSVFWSLSLD